ncbi:MAG: MBL fold metallo-hydrolase [Planctomycetes bacterium]|nr:MBL fold metallo-hydrolase [Planctomycetota bacterium]
MHWQPETIRAGEWTITALSDGHLRLDGGSMWGVVPATIWRKFTPPDEDNTIPLALRPFLAVRGDDKVLIEVGVGERWDPKWRAIYRIERDQTVERTLRAVGVAPEEITHVVASHCHWDHIGAQVVERDGGLTPLFVNARHFAPTIEIEMAKHPGHARSGSYRAEDVEPLERLGMLSGYSGTADILPGLRAHVLGGHSDGVALITLNEEGSGDTAVFWSDVVPTSHHIQPSYVMAYDLDVVRSFEQRSEWIARAAENAWIGMLYHDTDHAFGRIRRDGRRYAFTPGV